MTFFEFKDPDNTAFELDGSWFRIASTSSSQALDELGSHPLYHELLDRAAILSYERLTKSESVRVIDAASNLLSRRVSDVIVYAVEGVATVTYPWEWPDEMLRAAGLFTLRLREELLNVGLDLKDASALNIQFRGMRPVLMDVGSIAAWRPHPSWNAARQFTEHFINPLAASRNGELAAADFWAISRRAGLSSQATRRLMRTRDKVKPQLALIQQSTRRGGGGAPVEHQLPAQTERELRLAKEATLSLTARLRRVLSNIRDDTPRRTTWVDYGSRSHYDREAIDRKLELSRSFVTRTAGSEPLVLDVGGNDGFTAEDLHRNCRATVVVLDHDAGALDQLIHRTLREAEDRADGLLPLYADFTNLTWDSGVHGASIASFVSRVRPSAVLCQAVLHHVVITQGLPLRSAVDALAAFRAPLQIEFATSSDPKVELLVSHVPEWAGTYTLDELQDSLGRHYEVVEIVGRTTEHRVVVEGREPRQ